MILVKKINLYILVALVCVFLVSGEVRFFLAVKSVHLPSNLEFKYEVESFIFASIVLTIIVALFLIYFMRKSRNVFKSLDKIIDLSAYGEHDISGHLKQLGLLGTKINYLLYNLKDLNEKKSLRISSLSGINDLLIKKNEAPIFLLNRHGNIVNCSDRLLSMMGLSKDDIIKRNINLMFKDINYEETFFELERAPRRQLVLKRDVTAQIAARIKKYRAEFYPITNAKNQISHIVGILNRA
jgi:PAS domain-containing protein